MQCAEWQKFPDENLFLKKSLNLVEPYKQFLRFLIARRDIEAGDLILAERWQVQIILFLSYKEKIDVKLYLH